MTAPLVLLDARELRARPWLPEALPPWSIVIGPTGEVLRVRADGGADPVLPGGHPRPGIAAAPAPGRRAA